MEAWERASRHFWYRSCRGRRRSHAAACPKWAGRHRSTTLPTYHARSLHGLGEAGSIGLAPEHVAAEGGWAGSHDECKRVDVSAHGQEGQEAHPALPQHCLRLPGGAPVRKGRPDPLPLGASIFLAAPPLIPGLPLHGRTLPYLLHPHLYLLVQDGEGGRGHADVTWGPLLTATGGQDGFQRPIYHVYP